MDKILLDVLNQELYSEVSFRILELLVNIKWIKGSLQRTTWIL
jgi:hypothetical protein